MSFRFLLLHRPRGLRPCRGNSRSIGTAGTAADGDGDGRFRPGTADRAILKFYAYTGARIETGCQLNVPDFHLDGDEASMRFHLKGGRTKVKGIHFAAADAIAEYVKAAGIESGPLLGPARSPHSDALADRRLSQRAMYTILMSYLAQLPGALQERLLPSGEKTQVCVYSPHSLRATTATLLLDAREPIESVQDLLDHKHITTTQIYDKRRRSVRDSASHKVPI